MNLSKLISILGVLSFTIFSCTPTEDLSIVINKSGSLLIKAEGVTNGKLKVNYTYGDNIIYDSLDASGQLKTELLLEGAYYVSVESEHNNMKYFDAKNTQVIATTEKEVVLSPLDNYGSIEVAVTSDYYDDENFQYVYDDSLANVNIGIISTEKYSEVYDGSDLTIISNLQNATVTDMYGVARFENIPSSVTMFGERNYNAEYYIFVMNNAGTEILNYPNSISVPYQNTYNTRIRIYKDDLTDF
ncbi:hypothetical protein [Flammeovirga sp. SubArs3]|uniref:hypothetical protein n=1 Tax=Flammeovirga sp. SubArs3 TaxID=2995316 RepID=UPI00248CD4E5|nr:hypothetical protein [Flammeovirga sp. SubArs3]